MCRIEENAIIGDTLADLCVRMFKVLFVDSGVEHNVERGQLYLLDSIFVSTPFQVL